MLRIRVAALCVADGKVLLARHVRGARTAYLLPGGGLEPEETAMAALTREVREEVGARCEVGALAYVIEMLAPGGERHLVQLVFRTTLRDPIGRSSDARVAECAWHPIAALRSLPVHPDAGAAIADDLEAAFEGCRYILAPWKPVAAAEAVE
jgi:8-oxo-dGTP diphosphatase